MRIIGVDPGAKNIGIAISDPTGTIASPLLVIKHVSRSANAAKIAELANDHTAAGIVIGQSLDENGQPTFEGRRAARLAAEIRSLTDVPVELWDESFSTITAREAQIELGSPRKKRAGHLDQLAAVVILQSFLDTQNKKR
jgi:putative Holliday junction resolvase